MKNSNFRWLRRLHGTVHEWLVSRREAYFDKHIETIGKEKYSILREESQVESYPVDLVVLWVDPSDPLWLAEKQKYIPKDSCSQSINNAARYRDWGTFKFFFRGIEQYAKWVNKIHFVTWGHLPPFLDVNNPKIHIVKHEDIIPKEYLPTFNSSAIELNIHKIKGLSEHFLYLNDDMLFNGPTSKEDFFYKGFPRIAAICHYAFPHDEMCAWEHMLLNDVGIVNSRLGFTNAIRQSPEKWFPPFYDEEIVKWNRLAYEKGKVNSFYTHHLGYPLRVSTMETVWNQTRELLQETTKRKFRTMSDNTIHVMRVWETGQGTFDPVPKDYYGYACNISFEMFDKLQNSIRDESNKMVCINDNDALSELEFIELKEKLLKVLCEKFPQKSEFEK